MRALNLKLGLALLFILCLVRTGFSGGEEDTLTTYRLPEIVVTATRTVRALKDLSATVSVITREEIAASNANSCTGILNTLPGLFVQRTGAFGRADVDVRGLGDGGRRVMVLVDGRPVKMGLFGCTITHSLPLDNVERIEVVRGPLSVLYGSDALGGVINIITRRPTKPEEMDYTLSLGSHRTSQNRLRIGGVRGPWNFYATADRRRSDGYLPHSAYRGNDFTARVGYKIAGYLRATFSGKYFDGHKEEPLRATDRDTLVPQTWNDYKRGAVDLTLTAKGKRWNGLAKLYRNYGKHKFSDGWHSKDFTNGAILNGSGKVFPNNELTFGAEFRQQGGKLLHKPFAWEKEKRRYDKYEFAIFFHDEQILPRKLILTFGGRYNQDEVSGSEFCPQLGLVFHPREGTTLRGTVNKGFRSPQLNELYLFKKSNEGLKPEEIWNYEIGFAQRIGEKAKVELVGYRMKGENLIQKEKVPGHTPPFQFQNTGKFRFKGMEAGIKIQLNRELSGRIYYTYLDPGEKTKARPGDKVDLALRYAGRRLRLSLTGQYVADYFAADNRKEPIPDYFVANTKLSYELIPHLETFFAVDNILDREYEIYADIPGGQAGRYTMPKRTLTLGLNLKY